MVGATLAVCNESYLRSEILGSEALPLKLIASFGVSTPLNRVELDELTTPVEKHAPLNIFDRADSLAWQRRREQFRLLIEILYS